MMSHETEGEHDQRIRDAQLESRNRGPAQRSQPSGQRTVKRKVTSKAKRQPSQTALLNIPLGGARDIVIGVAIGLIPSILVVIFLPGAFKLVAVLILAVAGGVSYLLGNQTL
jgi:hypothetical protein